MTDIKKDSQVNIEMTAKTKQEEKRTKRRFFRLTIKQKERYLMEKKL